MAKPPDPPRLLPVPHCTSCGHPPHATPCPIEVKTRRWPARPGPPADVLIPCPYIRRSR